LRRSNIEHFALPALGPILCTLHKQRKWMLNGEVACVCVFYLRKRSKGSDYIYYFWVEAECLRAMFISVLTD